MNQNEREDNARERDMEMENNFITVLKASGTSLSPSVYRM